MMKKGILFFLLGILSLAFLTSAIGKQLAMDSFEATLNYYGFGLTSSSIAARLIISFEAFLAILLWLPRYRQRALVGIFSLTLVFSLGLLWFVGAYPHAEDCGCHGQLLSLNPPEALLKNFFIIGPALGLFLVGRKQKKQTSKWQVWVMVLSGLIMLAGPPILSPPDFLLIDKQTLSAPIPFPEAGFVESLPVYQSDRKFLLLFVSPSCKFCQFMTSRIFGLVETGQITLPIHFVILAEEGATVETFWKDTQVNPFPHTMVSNYNMFLTMSGQQLPSLYLMEGTNYRARFAYRTMSMDLIREFQREQD